MTAFRMPAEWEPHIRTWMVWPHRQEMWAPDLASVQRDYAAVARAIARFAPERIWDALEARLGELLLTKGRTPPSMRTPATPARS